MTHPYEAQVGFPTFCGLLEQDGEQAQPIMNITELSHTIKKNNTTRM